MGFIYDEDLAYVHQEGFSELARKAGESVLAMLARDGVTSGLIVDLGCGGGVWASRLARAGFQALGIDASEAMLRLARRNAPQAEFRRSSLYEASIPPCRCVTAFGEALNYRIGEVPLETLLDGLFRRISASLAPGGLLVFDVLVRSEGPPMRYRSWYAGPDWAVLVDAHEDQTEGLLTRRMTLFREMGRGYRRSEEVHVLSVAAPEMLESILAAAGFEFEVAAGYGDHPLGDRRKAYFARKAAARLDSWLTPQSRR